MTTVSFSDDVDEVAPAAAAAAAASLLKFAWLCWVLKEEDDDDDDGDGGSRGGSCRMIVRLAEGKKWDCRALGSAALMESKKAWMRALMASTSPTCSRSNAVILLPYNIVAIDGLVGVGLMSLR